MVSRIDERFEEVLMARQKRLGEIEVLTDQKPEFLKHAEIRALGGKDVRTVLDEDLAVLAASSYPSPSCLLPDEIEDFVESGALTSEQTAHLALCDPCRTLLEVVAAGPPAESLRAFHEKLRAAERESEAEAKNRISTV